MPNPFDKPFVLVEKAIEERKEVILAKANALGLEFFHENFDKQGWQGEPFVAWEKRKQNLKSDQGRHILVKSGALMRSMRGSVSGDSVVWHAGGPGIDYARIHNEGGTISHPGGSRTLSFRRNRSGRMLFASENGRHKLVAQAKVNIGSYKINMPQRRFMGWSPVLERRVEAMVIKEILTAFK